MQPSQQFKTLQNFRTYDRSVEFYKLCKEIKLPYGLKDQLMRAASSIPLNLSEGSSRLSVKDRLRFYSIAFGSLREVQAIIEIEEVGALVEPAHELAGMLYKLSRP